MIIEEKAIKPFEIALFGKSEVKKKKNNNPDQCYILSYRVFRGC